MIRLITLTEIYKLNDQSTSKDHKYALREIVVNPEHIFALREDVRLSGIADKDQLPKDLDERQSYTKIFFNTLNHGSVTVVGEMHLVKTKLLEK